MLADLQSWRLWWRDRRWRWIWNWRVELYKHLLMDKSARTHIQNNTSINLPSSVYSLCLTHPCTCTRIFYLSIFVHIDSTEWSYESGRLCKIIFTFNVTWINIFLTNKCNTHEMKPAVPLSSRVGATNTNVCKTEAVTQWQILTRVNWEKLWVRLWKIHGLNLPFLGLLAWILTS